MAIFNYIYEDEEGIICFDRYFEYLDKIKNIIPDDLYGFASDKERYSLHSKGSLHDSWLVSLVLSVDNPAKTSEQCLTNVRIKLLGPYHDRIYELFYVNVKRYLFANESTLHVLARSDLLFHEIRINSNNRIEHVIKFDNDINIFIECSKMSFQESMIDMPESS
jgi:hypothetical protein